MNGLTLPFVGPSTAPPACAWYVPTNALWAGPGVHPGSTGGVPPWCNPQGGVSRAPSACHGALGPASWEAVAERERVPGDNLWSCECLSWLPKGCPGCTGTPCPVPWASILCPVHYAVCPLQVGAGCVLWAIVLIPAWFMAIPSSVSGPHFCPPFAPHPLSRIATARSPTCCAECGPAFGCHSSQQAALMSLSYPNASFHASVYDVPVLTFPVFLCAALLAPSLMLGTARARRPLPRRQISRSCKVPQLQPSLHPPTLCIPANTTPLPPLCPMSWLALMALLHAHTVEYSRVPLDYSAQLYRTL